MSKEYLKRRPVVFLTLVVLVALSFLGGASSRSAPVRAQQAPPMGPTMAQDAPAMAPEGLFWCTVTDLWSLTTAVGVNCSEVSGGIYQFAYPNASLADSRQADRFLVIANTALVLNKRIWLGYNDSAAATPPGCSTSSCRRVTSMLIEP